MTMTPESALALRQPFPPESIGKLPKGGMMLDYVGHAAVTDRLLAVDPAWNWEPFATDPHGLPLLDGRGNLWIRLTICGVTRIGVGDGKSLKECIGDAIRNAAMRFGVALDLWAKEGLVEFEQAAREHRVGSPTGLAAVQAAVNPTPQPVPEPYLPPVDDDTVESGGQIRRSQRAKMFALFGEAGFDTDPRTSEGREARLDYIAHVIGSRVESTNELTVAQASRVIESLVADAEARSEIGDQP